MSHTTTPSISSSILRPLMPELDTLRGVAVSVVVLFHAFAFTYGLNGLSGIPKVLVGLTACGWTGVNLFFVLSGFLITGILLDTKSRTGVTVRETAIDLFFGGVLGSTLLCGTSRWRAYVNVRPLQFLGKISYGIYLTHMLIFEVVGHLTVRYFPSLVPVAGHFRLMVLQFCVAGSLTIMITCISRRYFEEPFLRMKNRVEHHAIAKMFSANPPEPSNLEVVVS